MSTLAGCKHISGKKTAEDCRRNLITMLDEVGLRLTSISVLVTDTEPTMNSMGRILEERDNVPWIGCLDHLINLVTAIAFDFTSTKEIMVKARKLIGTFTGSSQNLERLISAQEILRNDSIPKTLIQDVVTRWWSTYKSIERLLDLKPVIDYLTHANPPVGYTLEIDEWETLEVIKTVLEPFRNMQLYLEGSEYETIDENFQKSVKLRMLLKHKCREFRQFYADIGVHPAFPRAFIHVVSVTSSCQVFFKSLG